MGYQKLFTCLIFLTAVTGCNSDENGKGEVVPVTTSFSGTVVYEGTMEPVTNGDLFISGTDSEPLRSPIVRAGTILKINKGTFEVSFETVEEVDRFAMFIDILVDGDIINSFGWADGLQCLPGNCRDFAPGRDYELTIIVPCSPEDCVRFTPQ